MARKSKSFIALLLILILFSILTIIILLQLIDRILMDYNEMGIALVEMEGSIVTVDTDSRDALIFLFALFLLVDIGIVLILNKKRR